MKKILIALVLMATSAIGMAQINKTKVSGTVVNESRKPIESVTISLFNANDTELVKLTLSDKSGEYVFTDFPYGSYFVSVTGVGFVNSTSSTLTVSSDAPVSQLDTIIMRSSSEILQAVVVTAKKPLLELKAGKMIVNVDAAVTNAGATALEVLEKSPGVTVGRDGTIGLKGKSQVLVMIDGKPSYLSGGDLVNLLNNLNANQLSQIEIMTNPSAKYDASGNAGVINIRTKKAIAQGFNGSIALSYGQGVYSKSNHNVSLNYRTGKMNAFLNYGYGINNGFMNFDIQRNFIGSDGLKISALDQLSNRINQNQNHNVKLGVDYFISPQTTIGIAASGFLAPQKQNAFTTSYLKDRSGSIMAIENTTRTANNTWRNGGINLNFRSLLDSTKKELTANADYLHYDFTGSQHLTGISFAPDKTLQGKNHLRNTLPLIIDIYSGRLDYAHPLQNGINLEAGVKASRVTTQNTSDFFHLSNNDWLFDSLRSNSFSYNENVAAGYVNGNTTLGKWFIQGGLRLENTSYNGRQSGKTSNMDSSFSRHYLNLFPSAFISYKANNKNQFSISVGRRIDRPVYQNLNPFLSFIDKYTYSTGNPFLQPQFSNNVEVTHTYRNWLTTTLNYSVIKDMINETFAHQDSVIIRNVGNIGTRYNSGVAVSASIPVAKWLNSTVFTNLYQNKYKGSINGDPFNASAVTLNINVNNQLTFRRHWAAELSGMYLSHNRGEGQAIALPAGQISAGISRQLFNNKGNLKLNVRDIFYTQNQREIQNFQDVRSTLKINRDTRVVNVAFIYRFGSPVKSKSLKNPSLEEQERVRLN